MYLFIIYHSNPKHNQNRYALPELDGAIDTVVLGGLVGDKIALVPERVRKLVCYTHTYDKSFLSPLVYSLFNDFYL